MQSKLGQIELTESEQLLMKLVGLGAVPISGDDRTAKDVHGEHAEKLMLSLLNRKGIPESRWRYFFWPKYNISLPRASKYTCLMKMTGSEEALYRHSDFREYLRYFVFGAELPDADKEKFCTKFVETSGDRVELARLARR